MTTTQQPEAIRLAEWIESDMSCQGDAEIAAELRRLHARVVELEEGRRAIISEKDDYKIALRHARAELESIEAGGVESLSGAKPLTDEQIKRIDDSTHFHESLDWNLRFARAIEKHHGIGA